ncbi:orotate phosphoribosyltransferase [Alicyclobacillus sp. SO9]|nr:orotate phosphoribosyltransferase [Alicyclobacillus sp. SO9]
MSNQLAQGLLKIGAVELRPNNPFTWSSGWKSPIYCDNRLTLSYPVLRSLISGGLKEAIQNNFPQAEVLAGTATAGIPHAAFVAQELSLPMAYVRSSAKSHGKGKRIEGLIRAGSQVLVIEDTISTGSSAFDAAQALRDHGAKVVGVAAIFSYDFDTAVSRARELDIPVLRLLGYPQLIQSAIEMGYISQADEQRLLSWRNSPETFGV